jgi:hypothetical protein
MNILKRNKKIAVNRWGKIHKKEIQFIKNDKESKLIRAAICGFLAGDGSIQIRKVKSHFRYDIDFFPDDKRMLQTYLRMIAKVYGKRPITRKRHKFYAVRFTSRTLVNDLLKYCNFGIKTWTLPEKLFSIKGAKEEWLRAFYSAEGYVNNNAIRIQSVNKLGILNISSLLKEKNISHGLYEYTPKNSNHSSVGILIISKKADRLKFYDTIGFYHKKKEVILKKTLDL